MTTRQRSTYSRYLKRKGHKTGTVRPAAIPSAFAGESYIDWDFIDAYKRALADGMEQAFTVWSDYFDDCDYDLFQDAWCGEAGSEEDYARELAEECGLLQDVPESLRGYFDFEAFARDMFMNDFVFLEGYVFRH